MKGNVSPTEKLLEIQNNAPLTDIIPSLVNREGQVKAARQLGVSQAFIARWLKKHGYQAVTIYLDHNQTVTIVPKGEGES